MKRGIALALLAVSQAIIAGFVLALVLSSTAVAQTFQFKPPSCRPADIGGPGTKIITRDEPDVGSCYVGWWCPPATSGPWEWYGHCVLSQYKTQYVYRAYAAALASGDVDKLWADFTASVSVQPRTTAEADAFRGLRQRFYAQAQTSKPADVAPPTPPAPTWVVDAATSADGTRPAYPLVNGVRGKTSTARAASGQPCNLDAAKSPSEVVGKVFAAYGPAFSPTLVALCRQR